VATLRPAAESAERRALMQRVRRKGTPAERTVARLCRAIGLAYRLNVRALPGTPDLANRRARWAIFVNGCFWHHHTNCRHATLPKHNSDFWREKLAANRRRDAAKIVALRRQGFRVLVVWQCETRDEDALREHLARLVEAPSRAGSVERLETSRPHYVSVSPEVSAD
jgi:DNA mismatch endonuclease (patch repair protein)